MSRQRIVAAAAFIAAAAGIILQIVSGADYPTVPPGLVLVLAGAAVCLAWQRWWALLAAAAVSLFLLVGGALAPAVQDNLDAGGGRRWGIVLQLAALAVALAAAVAGALTERRRSRGRPSRAALR